MKIITLTLNPAFDTHCSIDVFRPYHENIANVDCIEAGGKGVNVSRALSNNGIENTAVVIVGTENQAAFLHQLKNDGLVVKAVETNGRIRENITLHPLDGTDETRICFNGFTIDKKLLAKVKEQIGKVDENTIVTMTGSIAPGITVNDVADLLQELRNQGAKIVIDSRSFSLNDLKEFKPWLTKPNNDEAKAYTGITVDSVETGIEAAKTIHALGIENAIVSLGGDGAVLACSEGIFVATAPKISVASTIGAGDSMIAGFVGAFSLGLNACDCLKRAVAYGSAACLEQGTRPPDPINVKKLESEIIVTEIN